MTSEETKNLTIRQKQSEKDKRDNREILFSKKRRTLTAKVMVGDEEIEWVFRALSNKEMDALRGKHPATRDQKEKDQRAVLNSDTFNPAMLAECSVDPALSPTEALDIFESQEWSTGELDYLMSRCYEVSSAGMGVAFTPTAFE